MFPTVLPLRAVAFQTVFLLIAIAIEAAVLYRLLNADANSKIDPKQSVQYATTINLLSTVVGWLTFFLFFGLAYALPSEWSVRLKANLVNFIFFDQWSSETATSLVLICFTMFFVTFAIKQAGLNGLRWLLSAGIAKKEDANKPQPVIEAPDVPPPPPRTSAIRVLRHETTSATTTSSAMNSQSRAVLIANAWSFSAILAILMLRFLF